MGRNRAYTVLSAVSTCRPIPRANKNATAQWPQAICDYVHNHIEFGYHHARCDRTASEGHAERIGVCRDFAHLAVTLCRCMNIPARYCTGYLGDIGVPKDPAPMDFSAWFEVFLAGRWFTFDARHNRPRIGRIVMARGRDAADVAISTAFGPAQLARFNVVTEELADKDYSPRNFENQRSSNSVGRWTESAKSAPCGASNLWV